MVFNIYYETIIRSYLIREKYSNIGNIKRPNYDYENNSIPCYIASVIYMQLKKSKNHLTDIDTEDTDRGIFYLYLGKNIKSFDKKSYELYTKELFMENKEVIIQLKEKIKSAFNYNEKEIDFTPLSGSIFTTIIDAVEETTEKQKVIEELQYQLEDRKNNINMNACFVVVPEIRDIITFQPLLLEDTPLYINKLK